MWYLRKSLLLQCLRVCCELSDWKPKKLRAQLEEMRLEQTRSEDAKLKAQIEEMRQANTADGKQKLQGSSRRRLPHLGTSRKRTQNWRGF
jgi:hypothetical protein